MSKFLAALAILHQDDLKKRINSTLSSYHPSAKLLARQRIEPILRRPFSSLPFLSFFYGAARVHLLRVLELLTLGALRVHRSLNYS